MKIICANNFCYQIRLKATNLDKYQKEQIIFGVVCSFVNVCRSNNTFEKNVYYPFSCSILCKKCEKIWKLLILFAHFIRRGEKLFTFVRV